MGPLYGLLGLLAAALFAITVFGPFGLDHAQAHPLVDLVYWTIIAAGLLPGLLKLVRHEVQAFVAWTHPHLPHPHGPGPRHP